MIRHRPFGIGHPYRIEPDQRVPAVPIANEPFELRATTSLDAHLVTVELATHDLRRSLRAEPAQPERSLPTVDGAHLAEASAGNAAHRRRSWIARPDPLPVHARLRYRFVSEGKNGQQRTAWFSVSPATWLPDGGKLLVEGAEVDRLLRGSISWLVGSDGPIRVRFALRLEPNEHIVGFGERFNALDQRGKQLDAVVYEQYKRQGARTYLPMPFAIVVGGSGWGFHLATSRRTWFDVGKTEPDRLWIEAVLDPNEPTITLWFFEGSPDKVLTSFLERTGRPKLPPSWIFRPWMSGNEWNTQARVENEVRRSFEEKIPVGVIVIEAWSDESTFVAFRDAQYPIHLDGAPHRLADFSFPAGGAWPDPKGMVDDLHSQNIKVLLWQIPLIKARPTPNTQARCDQDVMVARGYAVRQADGRPYRNRGWWFPGALLPDFTSLEAREWWLAKRRYLVDELGIDGFKTDGGEHAWGDDLRYADGSRGDAANNRYPVAYSAAYHELFAKTGREGITFSRAGFTGSAAYPCHWAGDEDSTWEAFRASITAGLTAGASGIFFWGWDLAGFSGEIPSAELYLRATAAACLCPIMQYHSEFNFHRFPSRDRTPWNIAERTGDSRVIPTCRQFAMLRDLLVPYLSEQSARAVRTSKPLMRALFFEFADDQAIWEWPHQYMLGDDLLVAPVIKAGVELWPVYLPRGTWVDAWTGEEHSGPATIQRPTPIDEIGVYIRAERAAGLRSLFGQAVDARLASRHVGYEGAPEA